MTVRDVTLAVEGLRRNNQLDEHIARRSTYLIMWAMGGHKAVGRFDRQWPVSDGNDGKADLQEKAREVLQKSREADIKAKAAKISNAGRT